ncbi:MAG: DegT/DnrJ/EryC1/StrS family aminotransferase [Patescibacteria group bacterium]
MRTRLKEYAHKKVEPSWPDVSEKDIRAVARAMRETFWSRGPKIGELEDKLARYVGVRHAVAVNSGTSALHLAVEVLGIGEGDLVICSPFSYVASANCILFVRARPVFVDIEPETYNIDPALVEKKITQLRKNPAHKKKLKAILATDIFGVPADWARLRAIAKKYGLFLIEDACEAMGAERKVNGVWRKGGSFGDTATFSFVYNKPVSAGEGGALVTNNRKFAELAWSLKNQGRVINGTWLDHDLVGYNYHLSDLNSALVLSQLSRVKEILKKRARIAEMYHHALRGVPGIRLLTIPKDVKISWFVYVVRLSDEYSRAERDRIIAALAKKGIVARIYFPPIHYQKVFREKLGYKVGDFPVAENAGARTIALPFHANLTREEIAYVAENFKNALSSVASDNLGVGHLSG